MMTEAILTKEKVLVENPDQFFKMPKEYQELVIRQMMVHTEGELSGADDYIEIFYNMAPNAYEKQVCCERGAEEVHHYIRGQEVLSDIGVDSTYMLDTNLQDRDLYGTEAVKDIRSWPERALFSYLGEAAVLDQLIEMAESSYKPIADMAIPVIKEEKVHVAHGFRITREYCSTEEGKALIQDALARWWPVSLDVFGRSNSKRSKLYVEWGLRKHSNEDARQRFIAHAAPRLEELGLVVPDHKKDRKYL
ncbi:Phenylacetic acid catabolic protein [Pseudomonas sp. HK3]